ncbi:MAG TPA: class I SAM-dependent methyltransferase [Candidatus Limnocylindria bacterium]|nr:class I SAM-dependent methyltransferase [Candidatus Limnocylindria bacterium]
MTTTAFGRFVIVSRHPRAGREVAAIGTHVFRGKDVLDIGTGDGRLAFDIARHARRLVAVDPNEEAIAAARARCHELRLMNTEFRVADAPTLDLGRARFDVAIFTWSL